MGFLQLPLHGTEDDGFGHPSTNYFVFFSKYMSQWIFVALSWSP